MIGRTTLSMAVLATLGMGIPAAFGQMGQDQPGQRPGQQQTGQDRPGQQPGGIGQDRPGQPGGIDRHDPMRPGQPGFDRFGEQQPPTPFQWHVDRARQQLNQDPKVAAGELFVASAFLEMYASYAEGQWQGQLKDSARDLQQFAERISERADRQPQDRQDGMRPGQQPGQQPGMGDRTGEQPAQTGVGEEPGQTGVGQQQPGQPRVGQQQRGQPGVGEQADIGGRLTRDTEQTRELDSITAKAYVAIAGAAHQKAEKALERQGRDSLVVVGYAIHHSADALRQATQTHGPMARIGQDRGIGQQPGDRGVGQQPGDRGVGQQPGDRGVAQQPGQQPDLEGRMDQMRVTQRAEQLARQLTQGDGIEARLAGAEIGEQGQQEQQLRDQAREILQELERQIQQVSQQVREGRGMDRDRGRPDLDLDVDLDRDRDRNRDRNQDRDDDN